MFAPASDPAASLDREWREAAAAVIHAQIAYAEMLTRNTADEAEVDRAWLDLWRAQERERTLSARLDASAA